MDMEHSSTEVEVLLDQEARDLITTELDRNVMVLAGAGAGKTHALIDRMVAAVRTGAAQVDRMAAITFTRKAAGEMRGRFLVRLREERSRGLSDEESSRIDHALAHIDQCFIGTIHAFCGRLLRERPIEAGLPPDFTEIEERTESELRRSAWNAFVQAAMADDDPRIYQLEEYGIHPEDLHTFFGRRCNYRDLPLKQTDTDRPDLREAVKEVERFISEVASRIPSSPARRDGLMDAIRRSRHFVRNHGIECDRDRALYLKPFEGKLEVVQKCWEDERLFARQLKHEHLPELRDRVVKPALRLWRESAFRLVSDFVDDAVRYYDRMRQDEGMVTFQDLLLRTEAVLKNRSEVRFYFQRRFQTILVDEFQDTDPVQAAIVMYLASSDLDQKDWHKIEPRPGCLFLVGDDKQSIYRFRRADVTVFRQVLDRIRSTDGLVLHLNTSFRSLGNLCKWISGSFPAIFESPSEPYQARFTPLFEYRPDGVDAHCVRKISISKVDRNRRGEILAIDAARITSFIAAAIAGKVPANHGGEGGILDEYASPGDFMILTRTATRISEYARALEARGIPYEISGGARLAEASEFQALIAVLETVYRPENPIPYLTYLRGPLVGLADDELYALRTAGGSFHFRASVPSDLDASLHRRLLSAQDVLAKAEEALKTRPPSSAVELILEGSGLLAYAGVNPDGRSSSRAGNLLRTMSLIRSQEAQRKHWGEITEELLRLRDDPGYELEEMTLESGRDDVVRLMNLHQAKGLQAKVVFLADPFDLTATKWPADTHVVRDGSTSYLSMTVDKPKGERAYERVAQPAGWADDQEEEERFGAGEEVRLLYVAATRAQNMLVVSRYEGNIQKGPWHPLYRYLDDVPELAACEAPIAPATIPDPIDWRGIRASIPERFARVGAASYAVRTVTGAQADETQDVSGRPGRGRDYGVVIHQLLESAVHGRLPDDEQAYIRQVVREARIDPSFENDAVDVLAKFRASDIWRDLTTADRVFTEVPIGKAEVLGDAGGVVRGVIDLVYRVDRGWKIVDYKTDVAETEADLMSLERKYRPQVETYAEYWMEITNEVVASSELWFAHGPRPV